MESRERDKISGLTFETRFGKPIAVFMQSSDINKCISYMKEHALENVMINSEHKYKSRHLDFLKENTFITSVEIETDVADCSALNCLHDLKTLMIHHSDKVVDFSNFPKLESLNLTWNENFINIEKCSQLKELTLWKYPAENLLLLKSFPKLEKLSAYDSKLQNLKGVEHCKKLTSVALTRNRNIESVESLSAIGETLTELFINGSKKLTDYTSVGKLSDLKNLYLLGCGVTQNINFIENLNVLEYGHIDIDIVDGQVGALLKRPIQFKNYKHFTHKNILKFKMNSDGKFELITLCANKNNNG